LIALAARTAYAIGLHRTEVNASFGESMHQKRRVIHDTAVLGVCRTTVTDCEIRDRIWKSLRVVDQFISNLLGRPPSTSDVDCTVKYTTLRHDVDIHMLDASVQIFMIIERVVVEVYSRKRISLRIASYVSHQLKGWAANWLSPLNNVILGSASDTKARHTVVGACQTLCSYYYGIMLLTRPFLIYELYEYLGASMRTSSSRSDHLEKEKFADAALDAAVAFVDTLDHVIATDKLPRRSPVIV
jgi:hypothetical protein